MEKAKSSTSVVRWCSWLSILSLEQEKEYPSYTLVEEDEDMKSHAHDVVVVTMALYVSSNL